MVLRAAASSELITQSKCPLCGGLMGHSERSLAVQNLLRNQLVPKIRVERLAEVCHVHIKVSNQDTFENHINNR